MTQGLRERKRRAAMDRIQDVALDLFDENGFDGVTIERIAALAEVSPSSVYRYFGTKEGIVLHDRNRAELPELLSPDDDDRPLVDAFRDAVMGFFARHGDSRDAEDRRRVRYVMEVPSVQEAVTRRMVGGDSVLAMYVARRTGRETEDLEVQVISGALNGALLGAVRHWYATGGDRPFGELLDEMFEALRRGFDREGAGRP